MLNLFMIAADFECANEYAFLADTQEEAEEIAKQYGGELISYSQGIAVLDVVSGHMAMGIEEEEKEQVTFYPEYIYTVELEDASENEEEQWHLQTTGVEDVWNLTKGSNIKVAVVDSGIDNQHEDLAAGIIVADTVVPASEYGENSRFEASYEGSQDNFGHGTHVAGIIGARDNGIGCNGIAPECSIISIKALEKSGSRGVGKTSWVCAGIRRAIAEGADIINLSLGGTSVKDELLLTVIQEAMDEGIVVVCAAGNITGTPQVFYPGAYEETIAVSALKQLGDSMTFASAYSNYGDWIDISAPGSSIKSTVPGGYGTKSGTSMACPVVAGSIALLQAKDANLSNEEICALLYDSATDMGEEGKDDKYGHGALNIKQLLQCYAEEYEISKPVAEIPDGSTVGKGTSIKISASAEMEKIVYTIDGTIPNADSERYPTEGVIFPEETNSVTILARCVTPDSRLGKCLSFSYSFVTGESSIEGTGELEEEIIPNYGAYMDPVQMVPCKRYSITIKKDEKIELTVLSDAFEPMIKIYDGEDENASLLTEEMVQDERGWTSSWKNKSGKDVTIWISVSIKNKMDGQEEMKYKMSWECKKEKTKQETSGTESSSSEESEPQESVTPEPSKTQEAEQETEPETATEMITEPQTMPIELSTEPEASVQPVYEEDWLYTMNTEENSVEASGADIIIEGIMIEEHTVECEEALTMEMKPTIQETSPETSQEDIMVQESTDSQDEVEKGKDTSVSKYIVFISIFISLVILAVIFLWIRRKDKE